jgi:hypothetical protein
MERGTRTVEMRQARMVLCVVEQLMTELGLYDAVREFSSPEL